MKGVVSEGTVVLHKWGITVITELKFSHLQIVYGGTDS